MKVVVVFVAFVGVVSGLAAAPANKHRMRKKKVIKPTPSWVIEKTSPALPKKKKQAEEEDDVLLKFEVMLTEDGEMAFAASEGPEATDIRGEMVQIYERHNPAKVDEVDALLAKYEGRETLLLSAVRAKYAGGGLPIHTPAEKVALAEKEAAYDESRRREAAIRRSRALELLLSRLPETADEVLAWKARGEEGSLIAAALARTLPEVEDDIVAADIAFGAPPADDVGKFLGNCGGVLGAFGAALAERPPRFDLDPFVAVAGCCGAVDRVEDLLRTEATTTRVPDATALVLSELARRLARKGAPVEVLLGLEALGQRWRPEHPELSEALTSAFARKATRVADAASMATMPRPSDPEIVFLGRSNAGKSSLVNALLGRKALAPTSPVPGRTRRFVFYKVDGPRSFRIVDVPGSGYAKDGDKIDSWKSLAMRYLEVRDSLRAAFHLVDSRRAADGAIPAADLDTLNLLAEANARRDSRFIHAVVLTKTDRLSGPRLEKAVATVADAITARGLVPTTTSSPNPHHVPIILTSAAARPPRGRFSLWRAIFFASSRHQHENDDDLVITF
ncbi:hypothetical protein CTAYLR_005786 [Chrysophaeum taylorii]|uniref:EngB-type G domain-containing protein n=1 Tax=Chrysophaeum taylorii TaxID=2483200 RepID=A0AAD7ULP0_9STRA|nr:hypothetical protein CTAYLR_005786 [Chrysophaeum taylorii]